MPITLSLNIPDLAKDFKELAIEVEQDITKAVGNLAAISHAKVAELASKELKSSRQTFMENLSFEEVTPGVWVVSIGDDASFIEDGVESSFDMKPSLLKDATKLSKDGYKYRSIPFEHSKSSSQLTPYAQNLAATIKNKMKQEGLSINKIEKNADGSPKIGRLHSFNIKSNVPGKGSAPALSGVHVYQSVNKSGKVKRDVMTFRTVSEGPASEGKWINPGMKGKNFLERAHQWAQAEFENNILPQILEKWGKAE